MGVVIDFLSGRADAPILSPVATDPALRLLLREWDRLRDDVLPPYRAALDPDRLGPILDRTFLLERRYGLLRIRLAGMGLSERIGMELHGMPVTALFGRGHKVAAAQALGMAFEGTHALPRIVEARLAPADEGLPVPGALLVLPLRDDAGRCVRAVGAVSPVAGTGGPLVPRRWYDRPLGPEAAAAPPPEAQPGALRVIRGGRD